MLISRMQLEPAVLGELQNARYKLTITRKIDVDEYVNVLSFGFFSLYYPLKKKELALMLKGEFKSIEDHLPDWWKYYWGWESDYNLGEYDTGDPIELATKILIGWTLSWKYIRGVVKPPRNVKVWTEKDFEDIYYISRQIIVDGLEDDVEGAVKTAAIWYAIISWTGYEFDGIKEVRDAVLGRVANNDYWMQFVVNGRNEFMKRVISDYTSWLPWPENIRG